MKIIQNNSISPNENISRVKKKPVCKRYRKKKLPNTSNILQQFKSFRKYGHDVSGNNMCEAYCVGNFSTAE